MTPKTTEVQLQELTLCVNQQRLFPSYIQEHPDAPATLISLQRTHIFCAYMLWIKYTDDNIESWYCLCRAGSSFRNVLTHLCDHKVPIVQALCGGLSAGSAELGESSRRRSCVWNWWGLDPKQKWNVNQFIRVSSKLILIQSSYMLGHTFLFNVLQDFVLKIAYGRSKKRRKKM